MGFQVAVLQAKKPPWLGLGVNKVRHGYKELILRWEKSQ